MNEQKGFFTRLGEALDQYRAGRRAAAQESAPARRQGWLHWLRRHMVPNVGTLLMVVVLLLTVPSLAAPLRAPAATSTSTISYQGRLADSSGNPLTGKYNLEFRIYDVPTGGVPLWTEMWTGGNAVDVSDGLFNVMLGSIDNTLAESIEGHDELYLGITVGADSEMVPRVQLGSVPFSMQAMTVPDGAVTTAKIADGAVTSAKLGSELEVNGILRASNLDRGYTAYGIGDGARPNRQICKVACGGPDSDDNFDQYWIWDAGIYQTSTSGAWISTGGHAHVVPCDGCAVICTCQPYRSW